MSFISKIKKPIAIGITVAGSLLTITGSTLLGVGCELSYTTTFTGQEFNEFISGNVPESGHGGGSKTYAGSEAPQLPPGYTPQQLQAMILSEYTKLMSIGTINSATYTAGVGASN